MSAALACVVAAQSTSVDYPAPVFSNEVSGRIAPRDIGDARLTRHFYTFNGREGDLIFTVESSDLNGNVDLFIAKGLRPLAQVTLYAGSSPTKISRSVYLQTDEALVLRVEARTASDADGLYSIRFEGAFAPASGAQVVPPELMAAPTLAETARRGKGARRVNSAGATIAEPPAEKPPADDSTDETPNTSTTATTTAAPTSSTNRANARASGARRGSKPARTARTTPAKPNATPSETSSAGANAPESAPPATRTRRPTRKPRSRTRPAPAASEGASANESDANVAPPAASAPVVTASHLVIETKDGERIERDMKGVRRFSIENNQVVIVGQDGKVQRLPLASVLRMSVEP
jgi:hypothetical protein